MFFGNCYAQERIDNNLEVMGDITVSNLIKLGHSMRTANRAELHLHSVGSNAASEIFFGSNGRNDSNVRWVLSDRGQSQGEFSIYEGPALNGNFTPRITILKGGNFGIGTSSPQSKLEVQSSGAIHSIYPTLVVKDISNRGTIFLESSTDNPTDFIFKNNNRFSWSISTRGSSENYSLRIHPSINGTSFSAPLLSLQTSGSVGIGTTFTGSHKLAVDGSIGAREVIVEAFSWSDFVFEKDYHLLPLEEVEKYIEKNGHLPDIPDEEEVLNNGINLGEMNVKLLQKIEELTIYLIKQNRELKSASQKIEELQIEISMLKNK